MRGSVYGEKHSSVVTCHHRLAELHEPRRNAAAEQARLANDALDADRDAGAILEEFR